MYDELVKDLRESAPRALAEADFDFVEGWLKEAADAIEELQKRVPKTPHGRLIDADKIAEGKFVSVPHVTVNGNEAGMAYRLGWNAAIEAIIENAETVIGGE